MKDYDRDYFTGLGWDGYMDDDISDVVEHTPGRRAQSGFDYNTHKGFSKSYKSDDFDDIDTPPYKRGHQTTIYTPASSMYTYTPTPTATDTSDVNQLSIVFMRQDVLNAMADHCKIAAKESEFQIHYRALIVKMKQGDATVHLSFPTAYYTFKQEVSHSAIDYELTDVDAKAQLVQAGSMNIVQEYLDKMPIISALSNAGFDVIDVYESNSGSMHRHPGRFGFSSVDYRKDPKNPGVVYRQGSCKDFLQTDSVMYLATKRTEIYTTESRIINLERDGAGVKGTYCRIPTVTYLYDPTKESDDIFTGILGASNAKTSGFELISCSMLGSKKPQYELLTHIMSEFASSEVMPEVEFVDNTDISSRISYAYSYWENGAFKSRGPSWEDKKVKAPETLNQKRTESPTTPTTDAPAKSVPTMTQKVFGVDLSSWERYLSKK